MATGWRDAGKFWDAVKDKRANMERINIDELDLGKAALKQGFPGDGSLWRKHGGRAETGGADDLVRHRGCFRVGVTYVPDTEGD